MVEVRVIERMPGLPYSASYARWEEHVDACERCQKAIELSVTTDMLVPAPLCETGQTLDLELKVAVSEQRAASRFN